MKASTGSVHNQKGEAAAGAGPKQLEDDAARGAPSIEQTKESPGNAAGEA
jgi:hypothetical protein